MVLKTTRGRREGGREKGDTWGLTPLDVPKDEGKRASAQNHILEEHSKISFNYIFFTRGVWVFIDAHIPFEIQK